MGAPDVVDTARGGRGARAARRWWCASRSRPSSTRTASASGRLEAERIGEGHSNFTFLVRRGDARVVLRRPPRPPLPPSAHDVLREARLLRALEGTPVRVPRVLAVGDDESVLGVPFYVMEEMHGTRDHEPTPGGARQPEAGGGGICEELVDALVEVHAVDWRACGLEGYGKPTGYLERQLRRFNGLWEYNKTRELPVVEEVRRLARGQPARVARGDDRARRLPARQRDGGRRRRRRAWWRSSTGSCPRSATRSPTSAT